MLSIINTEEILPLEVAPGPLVPGVMGPHLPLRPL